MSDYYFLLEMEKIRNFSNLSCVRTKLSDFLRNREMQEIPYRYNFIFWPFGRMMQKNTKITMRKVLSKHNEMALKSPTRILFFYLRVEKVGFSWQCLVFRYFITFFYPCFKYVSTQNKIYRFLGCKLKLRKVFDLRLLHNFLGNFKSLLFS